MNDPFYDWLRRVLFLPPQASTIAAGIDRLHYVVIGITMAGATAVGALALYLATRYRAARHWSLPTPEEDRRARRLDAGLVAFLLLLFVSFWVVGVRQFVRARVAPEGSMQVYVTGKQWMWKFAYPSGERSIATLVVPAGRPVQLVMTSRDVIHSFYVPDFRVKQDVLPGRYTTLWFEVKEPGRHQILCTEYCGTGHSTMRGEVLALSGAHYEQWLRGDRFDPPLLATDEDARAMGDEFAPREQVDLVAAGKKVAAEQGCLRCHTLDGTPHLGPTWAGLYRSTVALEKGGEVLADEAYLTESMMDPQARVVRGFQPIMPSYQGRLPPGDIAAMLELMRSLRNVTPAKASAPPWQLIAPDGRLADRPPLLLGDAGVTP